MIVCINAGVSVTAQSTGCLASEGGLLEGLSDDSDGEVEAARSSRVAVVKKEVCAYVCYVLC
jgi:hypothetical protein